MNPTLYGRTGGRPPACLTSSYSYPGVRGSGLGPYTPALSSPPSSSPRHSAQRCPDPRRASGAASHYSVGGG